MTPQRDQEIREECDALVCREVLYGIQTKEGTMNVFIRLLAAERIKAEAERDALLRERDEAVRLLGQITGQVRTLPGNTEIGFDFVMLLKRIDGFLSTQGSNTETTHPSPQSDTLI